MYVKTIEQRRSPRAVVKMECRLARRRGNPVQAVTQDVGPGGMSVVTDRPLTMDELLEFDLAPEEPGHPHGHARVVRQQRANCYALRFEQTIDDLLDWVATH
jgi:hypothetical protein